MNAVIVLCHFCEAHGPWPIFCTQTLRDSKIDEILKNSNTNDTKCPGCNSLGNLVGMISQDKESNANFLSTQSPVISDIVPLVKQAAVQSLSCEVSGNKDGSLVFFGDAIRGHVLSYSFQIHDSRARGFFRLFSIVILMKDKMFLLNIQPFLAKCMEKVSTELRNYSSAVYDADQAVYSERAQRLNSGQTSTQPPRSLIELTGEKNIFAHIHSHFTWILWMGARCLTEDITIGTPSVPPWIDENEEIVSLVEMDNEEWLIKRLKIDENNESNYPLRKCKEVLGADFIAACYCVIVGIQFVLRGPQCKTFVLMKSLRKLIPESLHKLTQVECSQYLSPTECRMLSISSQVAVPQPSPNVFRVDFLGDSDKVAVKWTGELPNKYPDLLVKILKAVDEKLLNDTVLDKQIRVLVEEWKNKVVCIQKVTSNADLVKIKRILGIQTHDQALINYWTTYL